MFPSKYDDGTTDARVHSGFQAAHSKVSKTVSTLAKQALNLCGDCTIVVTGHSLGAALATLSAVSVSKTFEDKVPILIYNYGSPRVGNKAFVNFINSKMAPNGPFIGLYRVVNNGDLVAFSPPRSFMGFDAYAHVSTEIWLTRNSEFKICNPGEDITCSLSVPDINRNPFDHGTYFGFDMGATRPHHCNDAIIAPPKGLLQRIIARL